MMCEVLNESAIERVSFDYGIEFLTSDGAIIRIEGLGTVGHEGEPKRPFDAQAPAEEVLVLLQFLHEQAGLGLDGAVLELVSKANRFVLRIEPSDEYEAWSVTFPDGSRLVCTTEGAVVRWPAS